MARKQSWPNTRSAIAGGGVRYTHLQLLWLALLLGWHAPLLASSALDYLARIEGKSQGYLPPESLDDRFTLALYVNAAGRGPWAQRMWVLEREQPGGEWRLGFWDEAYWAEQGLETDALPPYSWLVSTGKHYPGDPYSGPTPLGVYGLDERPGRVRSGYHAPGMTHVLFIDYHYSGGRRSGVAFHGTNPSLYRRLGRIDSHGCIRMTQDNASRLVERLLASRDAAEASPYWGEVPRFWRSERGNIRRGYSRDGTLPSEDGAVLTKTGYRAVAVIFRD